jgi:hypothetical protein
VSSRRAYSTYELCSSSIVDRALRRSSEHGTMTPMEPALSA